jgi:regulator of protease activity HflC (stomatin/prohibitin superfamily)
LQEKILKPGLHLTLPYPFDKVEIYDTETVNKTTIGYKATDNSDNIWTEGHQGEEYKLLLGGGDEVVSINLRLEYKISDLKQYLTTATSPESMMQALAYELVTDQTIATDLSSLMSADRDAFSENFQKELAKMMEEKNLGLEVVAVILESIHPPVEIAWVYQELISAGINAEKYLVNAQDVAAVTIAQAETTHDTTVGGAQVSYEEKVAAAKASVTEFMASVEAYNASSDAYKYQKYLAAVRKAYGNANLVILGEGVDQSAIYFGNIAGNSGNSASGNSGNSSNSNSNSKSGSNSTNSSGNSNTQQ